MVLRLQPSSAGGFYIVCAREVQINNWLRSVGKCHDCQLSLTLVKYTSFEAPSVRRCKDGGTRKQRRSRCSGTGAPYAAPRHRKATAAPTLHTVYRTGICPERKAPGGRW